MKKSILVLFVFASISLLSFDSSAFCCTVTSDHYRVTACNSTGNATCTIARAYANQLERAYQK